MKRGLITLFLGLMFCNTGFTETYYFKECKLTEEYSADYVIDFNKNVINASSAEKKDGSFEVGIYPIKEITKDQIVTQLIQIIKLKYYFQIYLDANSESVSIQTYRQKNEDDFILPDGPKKQGDCSNVKADWNKNKKEVDKDIKEEEQNLQVVSSLAKCTGTDLRQWANCQGTYATEDGYKYSGEWKNSKQHGNGIEMWEDGRKYVGQFKDDKRHGQGTYTLPDGTKYVGQFKDNKPHGQGTYIWSRGDQYVGQFKYGEPHGQGTYTFASGIIHSGQFNNGTIIKGTSIYLNGTKYVGEFQYNKPHGQGTFTYSNGGKYTGQFIDGYEYGDGICIKPNGSSIKCKIENRDTYLGDNKYRIAYSKKFLSKKNDFTAEKKIKNYFMEKASTICSLTGNFDILEQKVKVLEIDETPAFAGWDGKSIGIKLAIDGVVECKWLD